MFDKILIANRGEIACRVARTCRRLAIGAVAVYSEADINALHVELCDEAYLLGPAPARESYLRAERILEIAQKSGAQAIHPGYGFLSENAGFAEACAAAGITFIGPPAAAIRAMGSKSAAKALMQEAGVPVVPGYHGEEQDDETLAQAAAEIGYPVLIKASAGGGGKGMRVVESPARLKDAIASARREAAAAFGDDCLLLEKYLLGSRHIEIQVFADCHGNAVYLFERDCSLQRRYQKVIEEAPAPGLNRERRQAMGNTAVAAAQAIGYVNAGTVEFMAQPDGSFYFMEMNTRLQVEHPITEMITGQDLVEWQLRVAAGRPLPCTQDALSINGHAIEARLYAEDPERDFLPATGSIAYLRTPPQTSQVRIDTGVRQGDEVSVHYDPLIAKLIVWDRDRDSALRRLRQALAHYQLVGVTTNLQFLAALAAHPAFAAAALDIGFIGRHQAELLPGRQAIPNRIFALAALREILGWEREAAALARQSPDPCSPWHSAQGWRLNDEDHRVLHFHTGEQPLAIVAYPRRDHYLLELPGEQIHARGQWVDEHALWVELEGVRLAVTTVRRGAELTLFVQGRSHTLSVHDPLTLGLEAEAATGGLTAPMPGTIIEIMVKTGERVAKGAPLLILEAMKMEHAITAPRSGTIERIHHAIGDRVQEGAELLVITDYLVADDTPEST